MPETAEATAIRPFTIEIPEADVDDLRARVTAARLPSEELVDDRSQGVQLATIRALAEFWTTEYDWRACEASTTGWTSTSSTSGRFARCR